MEKTEHGKDRFVVVGWPDCQFFMDGPCPVHLANSHNSYMQFGDSAYFVSVGHYQEVAGHLPFQSDPVFLAVSFPETQLFMDGFEDEIYLINDEYGIRMYGHAAYFIEESLYKMVLEDFERESAILPPINQLNFK